MEIVTILIASGFIGFVLGLTFGWIINYDKND